MFCGSILLFVPPATGQDWGRLMVAPEKTNIRAARSVRAKLTGQLQAGERVRADFLKDGWYAVFAPDAKKRLERRARGYVHAPRLVAVAAPDRKKAKKAETAPARASGKTGKPVSERKEPEKSIEPVRSVTGSASEIVKTGRAAAPEQAVATPAPRLEASAATLPEAAPVLRQEPAAASRPDAALAVKNISVKFEPAGHERVYIDFNRDAAPEIYGIEGAEPRIVIDIHNVQAIRPGLTRINAQGRLIRQVRSSLDHASSRLRIVVDLAPSIHYEAKPVFYQAEKVYLVDIIEILSK